MQTEAPHPEEGAHDIQHFLTESLKMIKIFQDDRQLSYTRRLSRIQSKQKLSEFHQALMTSPEYTEVSFQHQMSQIGEDIIKKFPVKSPLTRQPATWRPLTTVEDITRESIEMCHCLFDNHLEDIAHGRMFAFSITESGGARATLSIKKIKTGWDFDQLAGKRNTDITGQPMRTILDRLKILITEHQQRTSHQHETENHEVEVFETDELEINAFDRDPLIQRSLEMFKHNLVG